MSSGFAPSAARDQASGVAVSSRPYPSGAAGTQLSLLEMSKRIQAGGSSPRVQALASDALVRAGFTGRGAQAGTTRERASALLDFVRGWMLYAPDPPNVEMIKSAESMLCVAKDLCIRVGDCDDQCVLLGSLLLSVGIPAVVVLQHFENAEQDHVIIEATDDSGQRFPLDPSYDFPAGTCAQGAVETRIDPQSTEQTGLLGVGDGMFIGVGKLGGLEPAMPSHLLARRLGMGALVYTPADVLTYRNMWDSFVTAYATLESTAGQAWADAAAGKTPSTPVNTAQFATTPDSKTLQAVADQHAHLGGNGGGIMTAWNVATGWTDLDIVYLSKTLLLNQQDVVRSILHVYAPQLQTDCPELQPPSLPTLTAQQVVISQLEGAGIIAKGLLEAFGIAVGGGLETFKEVGRELHQVTENVVGLTAPERVTSLLSSLAVIAAGGGLLAAGYLAWQGRIFLPKRSP